MIVLCCASEFMNNSESNETHGNVCSLSFILFFSIKEEYGDWKGGYLINFKCLETLHKWNSCIFTFYNLVLIVFFLLKEMNLR